jgi:hypothetical protein
VFIRVAGAILFALLGAALWRLAWYECKSGEILRRRGVVFKREDYPLSFRIAIGGQLFAGFVCILIALFWFLRPWYIP